MSTNYPDKSPGYSWKVKANDREFLEKIKKPSFHCFKKNKYSDNRIKTSKYNIFTFIPLNLYEQYHKAQVIYFTVILIIQGNSLQPKITLRDYFQKTMATSTSLSIPAISNFPVYAYLLPLVCILAARALRDLINDIARHRSDKLVNNAPCEILQKQRLQTMKWKDIQVGDIVRVKKDDLVPADMLLLSSTEPNGLCYVETAGIDGETNLKFRIALVDTHCNLNNLAALSEFDGLVTCETPNEKIYSFVGVLDWRGKKYPLNSENLLLRDCKVRNTEYCYGLVLYAGFDTKIIKNSGTTSLKWTQMDKVINKTVICIAAFMISVSILLAIGAGTWERLYLEKHYYIPQQAQYSSTTSGLFIFVGYISILCTLVPFFLYISLEIIHIYHNYFINNDLEMYYEETDTPAQARGNSFCDMLGKIEYVFTDKTGTLTQNVMTFKKCCIGKRIFGNTPSEGQKQEVSFEWNQYADAAFRFCDQTLIDELHKDSKDPELHEFFRAIALCHTVMSDNINGTVKYKATSPDEEALVTAAKCFGYAFLTRTQDIITISEMGTVKTYSILALMDFNSFRKRMSILVRTEEDQIKLYSKGADSVILERLYPGCETEFLKDALDGFDEETLRTLCLAYKEIEEQEYLMWQTTHNDASLSLENRQDQLEKSYEAIEQNLKLLGVTAIEDKLQEGVPETIQRLRDGNMKVWMLTGDKKETAINIAYSCNLLSSDMQLLEENDIRYLLENEQSAGISTDDKNANPIKQYHRTALVVTGDFLSGLVGTTEEQTLKLPWWKKLFRKDVTGLTSNFKAKALVDLACQCHSVICCRVTPQQKASIVQLVKVNKNAISLAIGDGGNDVNMIKTAHIGVGVFGKEGLQAVLASEFSVAQFSYLQNLLFFHGRLSYARISKFICYYNYKTFSSLIHNIWFAFFTGFSALPVFDSFFLMFSAIIYTLYPALCMAIFNKGNSVQPNN